MRQLDLSDMGIDDDFFKSFISFRLNELREITELNLRNNKLTYKSIEILINNLSSIPKLYKLHLNGNEIGDEGMKLLSPYHHYFMKNTGDCFSSFFFCYFSKLGLSSHGLQYLSLEKYDDNIMLDVSDNKIDSDGIDYLIKCLVNNDRYSFVKLLIHNNPIGNDGFNLLLYYPNLLMIEESEINLSNISIDDESVILLSDIIDSLGECKNINLKGNNIRIDGLKSVCSKSLADEEYPFIDIKNLLWNNEEVEYYLNYCIKKKRKDYGENDFAHLKIHDSHISLIKQIDYQSLYLAYNNISSKGLKELMENLPKDSEYIPIHHNPIGDEGIKIICENIGKIVYKYNDYSSINISNIGMSDEGLKMLIDRLKNYKRLNKITMLEYELNEERLKLLIENKEIFDSLETFLITVKENIEISQLQSFLKTFSSIGIIELNGISEEVKRELSKEFWNIK